MCMYWKKLHTCGHPSDRPYIEMCRSGCLSNTVCTDIGEDNKPRNSHFPCYPCIKLEARAESEAKFHLERDAVVKAREAHDTAVREKLAVEVRAKEERIRRDARDKANRERDEEARVKAMREREEERARKEGGVWIETGSVKKGKARKGAGSSPITPLSGPPVLKTILSRDIKKETDTGNRMGPKNTSPKTEGKGIDLGGRAGTWGPKKILSRKENLNVKK
jgi:hypothetical protein